MPEYAPDLTIREARRRYFDANGFPPDGGYADAWVKFKIGPIPIAFPNTEGRRRAVPFHDLHHVATGYDTDLAGEAEIGAWEIASGCTQERAALVLDLLAMWPVLFFAPATVYRAFLRGRRERNLYGSRWDDALLERSVGWLREHLGVDGSTRKPTARDRMAFAGWVAVDAALNLAIFLALVATAIGIYRLLT